MIDWIKIVIYNPVLVQQVWNHRELIFKSEEKRRFNDEIKDKRVRTFNGLTFTLFNERLEITGSLHKLFNNGIHNANDFSFMSCIRVILKLESIFDVSIR
ncbi:MAG: hypothetical protein FD181_1889 [Prolixibacteraceae bacterium]|nr:MAG: hypothetical protein FD181_1889 [Prolixibacteraceae bacterium]